MASFIPFVDCAESVIQFDLDGIPSVMTLGFRLTGAGPVSLSDLAALNSTIAADLVTPLAALQNSNVVYRNIHTVDLDTVTSPVQDDPVSTVGAGVLAGVANQVAMTVTFLTGLRGRSFRGRNFLGGLNNGDLLDTKTWGITAINAVRTVYENFDLALVSPGWEHVVLSRQALGVPRTTGVATNVIGYRPNAPVHTQRRRLK